MSASRDVTPDILVVPENPVRSACDCVVGDMHGNHEIFSTLMRERENPKDRIFVAGDLIDRGKGSAQLIRDIVRNNNDKTKGKIYCVRGNHEDMCVNAIDALMMLTHIQLYGHSKSELLIVLYILSKIAKTDPGLKIIFSDKIMSYFLNGACLMGKIAFNDYFEELNTDKDMSFAEKVEYLKKNTDVLERLSSIHGDLSVMQSAIRLHQVNGGQWLIDLYMEEFTDTTISATEDEDLDFSETSTIMLIKKYLDTLPYIIHVKGEVPFNIVHADMPINDVDMQKRIADGGWLTDDEKEYAMWARPLKGAEIRIKKMAGRNKYSILSMTGHTIDGSVRKETNTLNLDVAAYARNSTLVVKMPSCSVHIIVDNNDSRGMDAAIMKIADETQQHLKRQVTISKHREAMPGNQVKSARMFDESGGGKESMGVGSQNRGSLGKPGK